VPAAFWRHEPVRRALAERHLGRVIRAYRCHPYHGRNPLPQSAVAGWLGITQAQLSRVENGSAIVHLDRLTHWALILRIPAEHLWFALPDQPCRFGPATDEDKPARSRETAGPATPPAQADAATTASDEGGGTTDRRQFHALAALAGIAVTGSLDLLTTPADAPRSLGMEQVRFAGSLVEEFRRADSSVGAVQLCDIAIRAHARLSAWAAKSSYSREVGDALQTALADLAVETAWLTIDAGRRPESRPYLNEAIARARLADDPRMEVRAFACLSLLIRDERPGESLQSAEAALRTSAPWGTPRLAALLHLRTASAYATMIDMSGFNRAIAKAYREFERGRSEDDMPFLHFVNQQELNGIEGLSYLALGRADRAAKAFRTIVESPAATLRRNQVYYLVQLADAECRQGDHDEAARLALGVLPAMAEVNSGRVSRHLAQLRSGLAQPQKSTAATREFTQVYDETVRR
jgi:transcriptional regulator with XRE-family HTH domain/tetratricopeptide (TPR) repeat protein